MPSQKNKKDSSTRKVILEYNKNIIIHSYSTWAKTFTGEFVVNKIRKNGVMSVREPTLTSQGYTIIKDSIEFELTQKEKLFKNKDIVKYILGQQCINPLKEVVYDITREQSGEITARLFYK